MITLDTAWGIVVEQLRPLPKAVVPLGRAVDCCLAEDIRADRDLPPADRSTMDGYAVRSADVLECPRVLRVFAEVAAGGAQRPLVRPGTCVRIFTGANVPPGADAIVIAEETEAHGDAVTIRSFANAPGNIRRRGEDARRGAVLLPSGTRIGAAEVGVCAAVGKASVVVHRRPRVAILCTGSELRPVKSRLRAHEIRNSNGPSLAAALAQWGFAGASARQVADRPGLMLAALKSALKRSEVILFTGGVSAGNYDFVRSVVEAAGATIRFHKVAIKPGKPTLYATAEGGRHIFGLPGNPLSTFTALHEFALPALRRLAGCPLESCRPGWLLPLAADAQAKTDRIKCELARLVSGPTGLAAMPVRSNSSADLAAAGGADGVVFLDPARGRLNAGEWVTFRPWRPLP